MVNDKIIDYRQSYYDFLENAKKVRESLQNTINSLEDARSSMKNAYVVNEETPYDEYLLETIENTKNIYNSLTYTIIPAIEDKIDKISLEMDAFDSLI